MSIIKNNSKSVKVLKAAGMPALRLFPGFNNVPIDNPSKYLDGNESAKALFKSCLLTVKPSGLTNDQAKEAEAAKEKNDRLNKSQKIIKQKDDKIKVSDKKISEQEKMIQAQGEQIKALINEMEKLKKIR